MSDRTNREQAGHTTGTSLEQLSVVDAISHLLTASNFDLDALLSEITRLAAEKLHVKGCAIRLLDEQTGEMVLKGVHGLSSQFVAKGPVIARKSAFREVIESGEITEVYDVARDPKIQYPRQAIEEGISSVLLVGLIQDGRAIGALSVYTHHPHRFLEVEVRAFQTIANQATAAIHLAGLHRRHLKMKRIEQELAIASQIQSRMMSSRFPRIEGFDMAARTQPSGQVGGDFYDFIELPDGRLGLVIADVSGKGIPAALLMAMARIVLRVEAQNPVSPEVVIARANRMLCREISESEFVTLFYGVLDARQGRLVFVNAGHNFPVLLQGKEMSFLETGGVPLGLFCDSEYEAEVVSLPPGSLLALYSDGFVEASGKDGEQFGKKRFCRLLREYRQLGAAGIMARLEEAVAAFESSSAEQHDDRTLVIVKT